MKIISEISEISKLKI